MALKRFCDRCNDEIKYLFSTIGLHCESNGDSRSLDICARCERSYEEWLKVGGPVKLLDKH